jgi:hypothetical protein
MHAYKPDRVVKALTTFVSIMYHVIWVGALIALIGLPAVTVLAGNNETWTYATDVPVVAEDLQRTVLTNWGPAQLDLDEARAKLRLPIATLPWWFAAMVWALVVLTLAAIFRRGAELETEQSLVV